MKTGVLIQARMRSTRLPGKVLLPFCGTTILGVIANKIRTGFPHLEAVICTSTHADDDAIATYAKSLEMPVFRGSEHDVLERFLAAADGFGFDRIVRVCADNPFLDMQLLQELITFADATPDADYWSFADGETPSIKTHYGFFAEVVKTSALQDVARQTQDMCYREHVTNFVYSSGLFDCRFIQIPDWISKHRFLRLTVDDENDFALALQLYAARPDLRELVNLVLSDEKLSDQMAKNIEKYSK